MDTNYYGTFIAVAEDCPAEQGVVPPTRGGSKTKAGIEYELAAANPYRYTSDELLIETHIRHKGMTEEELLQQGEAIKAAFTSKPQPCLRASMLPKKFGWGIHFDSKGRLALYPVESAEYRAFVDGSRPDTKVLRAMRNKKKST
ncbi:DUF6157 family protein [Paenibacillus sp. 1P07SE]|uniref:DUF6157 family protein n=1 Tax=Paenibacillus sp. 1P07SE TaxID=3132209 RepID=UPI0039A68F4F